MITALFCDVCGAALSTRAQPCPACGHVQRSSVPVPASQQASDRDELQPGFLLRGRYRIQQKIGEGGFGLVYKAWDEQRKRQIAIKQITLAALSAREMIQVTDSYNRETTLLPKLRHKSLPVLYHQFTDPGHWYLAMQYINGQTLEERLMEAPQGRLPVGEVLSIGAALCDILGYLHRQDPSIVFRDVKPANIMRASNGRIYLIDFGIARRYREGQSKDTGPLGSPGYAAPEQYGKAQSTPRTDMYGLGATLQTLLTGKEPWEIQATGIPTDCDIPDELQTLIAQMLAPEPERRPASMKQVGESLPKLRQNDPLSYPFSLLIIVWLCLMMAVRSFLFDHLTFLFALLAFPLTLLGMACLTAIIMGYYFCKAKLAKAGRLIGKDLRLIAEKSMEKSLLFISITSFWGTVTSISGKLLDVKVLIYLAIFLAGLVLLPKFWPLFLEKIKQKRAAQHSQLVAQTPPMEQEIHRRQF